MVLYQCEYCGYTTDRKNNLKNHENRKNKCFLLKKPENETTHQSLPHKPSQKKKNPHKPSQIWKI